MELGTGTMNKCDEISRRRLIRPTVLLLHLAALVALFSGCIGFASQVLYTIKGNQEPAAYEGLEGKRVAVIAMSSAAFFDPSDPTGEIAQGVSELLRVNVKDIELVDQDEIADWIDNNDWQTNYKKVGIGVKADRIVAIDFTQLSFRDSSTLVKGRADFTVTVFDVHSGNKVFRRSTPEHEYPRNSPADMRPKRFHIVYTSILSKYIASYFYDHPIDESFATDAISL